MARRTGLEPATPGVTGRYSNQLSYHRASTVKDNEKETWWVMTESNRRHSACKADALPTELITRKREILKNQYFKIMARRTGLEPATPGVTGRYSNQLSYHRASTVKDNEKETWWVMTESNRRHSACKADALPTELITRAQNCEDAIKPKNPDARKIYLSIIRYLPASTSFQRK